jgi:GT2 family glycosyltransferase
VLPSVSIVIPTYSRPHQLVECLRSLGRLDYPRDLLEVVVVDDGGPALLDDLVTPFHAQFRLTLIRQENGGPAAARNTGADRAQGEYLAFTDDDCVVEPGWLRALAAVWDESPRSMVGGRTLNGAPGLISATGQLITDIVYRHYNVDPAHARFIASNNMALPVNGFREIGGFDPAFRSAEDRDLCDRWLHHGNRIIYQPDAVVRHIRPLNTSAFCRVHFHYGSGAELFIRRRAERGSGDLLTETRFHLDVRNWLWFPLTSVPPRQVAQVAVLLGLWQAANFAGFAWAAVHRVFRAG